MSKKLRDEIALAALPTMLRAIFEAVDSSGREISPEVKKEINIGVSESCYELADEMVKHSGVRKDVDPKNHKGLYSVEYAVTCGYISIISHDGRYVNVPIPGDFTREAVANFFNP